MAEIVQIPHVPVMLAEVLSALSPKDGAVYADATFGAGGYSRAILEAANCNVCGFDRDPSVKKYSDELEKLYPSRFKLYLSPFSEMKTHLGMDGINELNGVVFDLGVSSMQLDTAERGFSFGKEGPLDMRMGDSGRKAWDLINTATEREIADVIFNYGEERKARRIAFRIVEERKQGAIETTTKLADIVSKVVGRNKNDNVHPATRTFQAIRIWVNDELGELERGIAASATMLAEGGHMVVVSFHSLEDRIVKNFFTRPSNANRHLPELKGKNPSQEFRSIYKGAVKPTEEEMQSNPRSRSAKLRAYIKTKVAEAA